MDNAKTNADTKPDADADVAKTETTPDNPNIEKKVKKEVKKTLTLLDLILMGLANIVGAGIFVIIGKSIKYGGKQTLYALMTVAIISLIMGFCFVELYDRFKSSIVEYIAIQNTMGDMPGQFMIYLTYFFAIFTGVTIVISISKYLSSLGYLSKFKDSSLFQKSLSIFLLCLMSFINYMGIETAKVVANTISITMLITLGALIFFSTKFITVEKTFKAPDMPWSSFILSTVLSLFLFNGYDFIVKVSDETINPANNKTAIIGAISLTTGIYIAVIIAAICVLGFKTSSTTSNVIVKIYEKLTNYKTAMVVYIIGAFIMFNTAFLSVLSATKFMQVLGKEKKIMFPDFWAKTNKFNSPSNAIYASLAITILLAIINNEVLMAIFTNMSCIIMLFLLCVSVLILRWKERNNSEAQKTHNFIVGNINNIPIIVILNACVLVYIMYVMLKNKFWIGKV
jgi:APA family basic amino acid/polyamine antiporter